MVRYRFFLYAGLLPYLLARGVGVCSRRAHRRCDFLERARRRGAGRDRRRSIQRVFRCAHGYRSVFNPKDLPPISDAVFWLGVAAFAGALRRSAFI
jgi:1,4-dihydroxy-2-naphthoate octaprenyltransferase